MKQKESAEEIFKKLKKKLDLNLEKRFKLSQDDIEYLAAVVLLELDKGKRKGTLSEMDTEFIEKLKSKVEKPFNPSADLYRKETISSQIDKKG